MYVLRDVDSRLYVKYTLDGVLLWHLPLSNYILLININFASGKEQEKRNAVSTLAEERILKTDDALCTNLVRDSYMSLR